MHCIHCESTDTVKSGKRILTPLSLDRKVKRKVQRYLCNTCKRTFSKRKERRKKFSMGFKVELTRNHVEERMSYRVISKRIKEKTGKQIWHSQICKMVNEVAKKSKGSLEIKNEYSPVWEGHLVVDDKVINI
jgi:transposase-like protein